jgi:hypothetical protein
MFTLVHFLILLLTLYIAIITLQLLYFLFSGIIWNKFLKFPLH